MFTNEKTSRSVGNHQATGGAVPGRRKVGEGSLLTAITQYRFDPKLSKAERIAHFLDWMAKKFPGIPVPANLITKAIYGYGKKPRMGTEEVLSVQGCAGSARNILRKQYNRGLLVVRNEGMRATIDSEDVANTTLQKCAQRLGSAKKSLEAERSIVNPSEIKDEELRKWVKFGVDPTLKMLDTDARLSALLPAKPGDEPKEPAKK